MAHWNKGVYRYPNAENEVHYCHCPCGEQIPFIEQYRSHGYPQHINHHYGRGHTKENDPVIAARAKTLAGRTKESYSYLASMAKKTSERQLGRTAADYPYLAAMGKKKRGRTKENHLGVAIQAEKMQGKLPWNAGLTAADHPSIATIAEKQQDNKYGWRGGRSSEPYTVEFNEALKESIRQRDGYCCQECYIPQAECIRKLDVHHIDYDKGNCDYSNLISLCRSCNSKVNANREYWAKHFKRKVQGWLIWLMKTQ